MFYRKLFVHGRLGRPLNILCIIFFFHFRNSEFQGRDLRGISFHEWIYVLERFENNTTTVQRHGTHYKYVIRFFAK